MVRPETITLTLAEIAFGANVGVMRQVTNLRDNRAERYGAEGDGFAMHIMGCHGEIAMAKYRNTFWSGQIGNLAAADIGPNLQVRATRFRNGRLVVHEPYDTDGRKADKPTDYFICARVLLPRVVLVGWLPGHQAQQDKYWQALPSHPDRPAYFVDNEDLLAMSALPPVLPLDRVA